MLLAEVWVRSYWKRSDSPTFCICITPNSISSWEAAVLELLVTFLGTELVGEFLLSHCLQFLQIMEAGGSYQFQNSQTCCVCLLSESSPSKRECFNSVSSLCFTSYGFDYDINILNIFCRILTPTNSNAMNLVRQHLRPMTEILFFVTLLPAWCSCQHYWKRSWFVSFFCSVTMKVCVNPSKLEYIVGKKQNQCSYIMVTYLAHNKISLITFEVRVLFVLAVLVLECTTLRRWFQPSYHLDQCQASTWIFSAHLSELLLMSYEAWHPFFFAWWSGASF